jgi:4-amino-4-deoxy-L-arabinose transferase-like glycosyltransferase
VSTSSASLPAPAGLRARLRTRSIAWPPPELGVLVVLSAALYLWALDRNGFANEYYGAAVRSMAGSWHDFLYGSFDPSGVMTVDKPPLALWIEALSARVFGFGSWSILVPEALMGVASVALTWDLTRRRFGRAAGFAAGLVLALTPMTVAISRHNNPDALLILCVVAAVWLVVRGLEDGRTRWIVLAGVCVGLGFEAKMGAALLVVPGIAAAWMWMAPRGRLAAARQLLAGGAAMTVVGLAWPVLVWLTPAADRPWISGTSDNSIWSLIFGYNGFGRLLGQQGGPGGGGAGGGPGGGGGGGPFGGDPGLLRLLNSSLGGQAGWLLGFAVVAGVAAVVVTRLRREDQRSGWVIAVGGTFLATAVAFSLASGIFHPYYVSQLAPFTAALVGAGVGQIVAGGRTARVVGPLAVVAGIVTELAVLGKYPGQLEWVPALLVVVGGFAALALAMGSSATTRVRVTALAVALGVLLLAPASWAVQTLNHPTSGTFPAGGPESASLGGPGGGPGGGSGGGPGGRFAGGPPGGLQPQGGLPGAGSSQGGTLPGGGMFGGDSQAIRQALAYAKAHGGGTLAVSSQTGAEAAVINSGADVAGIGGFSGRESQVSVSWLADAVERGQIRWVLTDGSGGGVFNDGRTGSADVMAAVEQTCTKVNSVSGLHDCAGHANDLRALANEQ